MSDVKLCSKCKGNGELKIEVGYGHNGTDYEWTPCKHCNGTGRVRTNSYSYEVPFDIDLSEIYQIDSTLHETIREFLRKIYKQK